ncbi:MULTISPECIES: potassium channel family protein [unclassified Streptomyces]|uniref:potassium channel family protein n=1 Tax=unclassified Streptomyces TaxID=2593676 RepID=UPI004041ED62
MEWLVSLAGVGLVMVALRDLFHTLWHPTRHAGLSRLVMTGMWRLARRLRARRRVVGLVGPLAMVTVVGLWAAVIILGWAIIYWPHMPGAFTLTPGSRAAQQPTLLDSVYLSLVTVATLGLGDITPAAGWLRLVSPLEALVGFALLTATVSWVLEVYPALTRRRVLAIRLALLRESAPTAEQLDRRCRGAAAGQPGHRSRARPNRFHSIRRGLLLPRRGGPLLPGGHPRVRLSPRPARAGRAAAGRPTDRRLARQRTGRPRRRP